MPLVLFGTARHSGPIELLLTDVVMPGLSGPEAARRIVRRRPELKVIFFSGYPGETMQRQALAEEMTFFLKKPFSLTSLDRKMTEALEECA